MIDHVDSPIGTLVCVCTGTALCALSFTDHEPAMLASLAARYEGFTMEAASDPGGISSRLQAYFAGDLQALHGITVETGGTAFERRVWSALLEIPAGATVSYGELAGRLGSGSRAVGSANSRNPVAIVVPCHRVVGANGHLTGYAGGLERKLWLLRHEGVDTDRLGRVRR
ncbi:MAG: methylated-DNA--[protein]-cysteine S-methyltransferase [Firmicutes bacterium]|nr:methylated-DNA--[protein]-cysteine S-methyltransferase [Bacillota bacterium]